MSGVFFYFFFFVCCVLPSSLFMPCSLSLFCTLRSKFWIIQIVWKVHTQIDINTIDRCLIKMFIVLKMRTYCDTRQFAFPTEYSRSSLTPLVFGAEMIDTMFLPVYFSLNDDALQQNILVYHHHHRHHHHYHRRQQQTNHDFFGSWLTKMSIRCSFALHCNCATTL